MTISATAATLSSFSGLYELALAAGWAGLMAPLLPLTIDAFAATATRVWLSTTTASARARKFARTCAVGAIILSLSGNAIYHLLAAGLLVTNWMIVLVVGAIPPVVLGLVSHLAVLRRQIDLAVLDGSTPLARTVLPPVPQPSKVPAKQEHRALPDRPAARPHRTVAPPKHESDAALLAAGQRADQEYRRTHDGKPITRDELRRMLRIGGDKATALLRQLKEQPVRPDAEP